METALAQWESDHPDRLQVRILYAASKIFSQGGNKMKGVLTKRTVIGLVGAVLTMAGTVCSILFEVMPDTNKETPVEVQNATTNESV